MEGVHSVLIQTSHVASLTSAGFGSKKRLPEAYQLAQHKTIWREKAAPVTITGAGGRSVHLASCHKNWPLFDHLLPEMAFVGHSNSGKSTLVNAMIGVLPRKGPAQVSERAGWTDQLCFYQLGKKPPLVTLVDCPGYGHAVATPQMKKEWKVMTDLYMKQRMVLSRCYVLVDSTRGLCQDDVTLLKKLNKSNISWKIILTKCDLLSVEDVARSMIVVHDDLMSLVFSPSPAANKSEEVASSGQRKDVSNSDSSDSDSDDEGNDEDSDDDDDHDDDDDDDDDDVNDHSNASLANIEEYVMPVSASTGANVGVLWNDLCICAEQTAVSLPPSNQHMKHIVREHRLAGRQRRQALEAMKKSTPQPKSRRGRRRKPKAEFSRDRPS